MHVELAPQQESRRNSSCGDEDVGAVSLTKVVHLFLLGSSGAPRGLRRTPKTTLEEFDRQRRFGDTFGAVFGRWWRCAAIPKREQNHHTQDEVGRMHVGMPACGCPWGRMLNLVSHL